MKKSAKIIDLQLLAIKSRSLANTRKIPSRCITDLFNFSNKIKNLIEPISDELDNLKAAEEPITEGLKRIVLEEIKNDNADEINQAYAMRAARHTELNDILRRRRELLSSRVEIDFTPISITVPENFIDEMPKKSTVSFNGVISETDPLDSYFDLINEGIIVVTTSDKQKSKSK